jgi:hypothetical protein
VGQLVWLIFVTQKRLLGRVGKCCILTSILYFDTKNARIFYFLGMILGFLRFSFEIVAFHFYQKCSRWLGDMIEITPGETENEWQKTEPVPILLLRGARSFFDAKKIKKKKLLPWTSEIIQFIRYPIQMDRTERSNFLGEKADFL